VWRPMPQTPKVTGFPRREVENGQYRFVNQSFVVTHRPAVIKSPQNKSLASIGGEGVKSLVSSPAGTALLLSIPEVERPHDDASRAAYRLLTGYSRIARLALYPSRSAPTIVRQPQLARSLGRFHQARGTRPQLREQL
jgi:hypothetical protein